MEQVVPPEGSPSPAEISSFGARAADVFASPATLYAEVASAPVQTTSWLIPLILTLLLAVVSVFVVFGNPSMRQQIIDKQSEGMKEAVAQGKMTQEQADRTTEMMESGGGTILLAFGSGGAVLSVAAIFFLGTLVLWLAARFILKSPATYKKTLEIFGLASMVGVLGTVITMIMMNYFGSLHAIPAPSVLLSAGPSTSFAYKLLAGMNIFTIWETVVTGIGLSKAASKGTGAGIGVALGCFLLMIVIFAALGWGS